MNEPSSIHDTEAEIEFDIRVRIPRFEVPALAEAMTGDDDDVILAAEKAMRAVVSERAGVYGSELELAPAEADTELMLRQEARVEVRSQRLYGRVAR